MKNLFRILLCCYVATFLNTAQAVVSITIINNGGTAYGVTPIWSSTTTPNVNNSFGGGSLQTNVPGTDTTLTASGWDGPSFGGLGSSPKVSLYYYSNRTHWVALDTTKRTVVALNATYSGSGPVVLSYTPPGASDPTTNLCNVTLCGRNNDVVWHRYQVNKNGSAVLSDVGTPAQSGVIQPGANFCVTIQMACTNTSGVYLDYSDLDKSYGYQMQNLLTNASIATNSAPTYPSTTNQASALDPNVYTPGQTNIIWSAAAATNTTIATREGTEALKAAIDGLGLGLGSAISNLATSLGEEEGTGNDGITNAIDRFRTQNTNLLSQILTNFQRETNVISSVGTNEGAATSAGMSAIGDVSGDIDSLVASIGTAPGGGLDGSGNPDVFSFAFAGRTIDMNPETHLPGVMGIAKTLFTMVALILFGISVTRLLYDVVKTFSTAQTGGVPDLNTLGFNAAGAAVFPIVSVALIAVWVIALVAIIAAVVAAMTTFASAMTAAAGISLPAGTSYLLYQSFPVTLIISLAFSRILIQLTAAKSVAIAAAISRFLIGK